MYGVEIRVACAHVVVGRTHVGLETDFLVQDERADDVVGDRDVGDPHVPPVGGDVGLKCKRAACTMVASSVRSVHAHVHVAASSTQAHIANTQL